MAVYHLSAELIQRSKGHSAVAAAAYRAGEILHDERLIETQDYSRKSGVVQSQIVAPENAPAWVHNREELWNQAEQAEKRRDAQPAREVRLALPDELTDEQRAELVFAYSRDTFVSQGMVADISIHRPARYGDERNHHAHILLTMRELDGDQFARTKQRDWNRSESLEEWRERWEEYQNRALEDAGSDARVDHRTLEAQGVDREPTIHLGKATTTVERQGKQNERGDRNREIIRQNQEYDALVAGRAALDAEIASHIEHTISSPVSPEESQPQPEPAISWEEEARAQDPANSDVTRAFEGQIAVYELDSSFAFLADREPDPAAQAPLTWEEEKERLQHPSNCDVGKALINQIQEQGQIKEYGLGKSWFNRTVAYFENLYSDTATFIKDTWQEYVTHRDRGVSDPDKDDPEWGR